ncbi:vWA domain-containing protein [Mastigocoleus testarum]|uniref:VWA containing CoxE family protein n=1 Tax=Mastigocoleus testarum BC008 TaxID=371196 RepID=A0A0V7ZFA1_9CYAN|nr:VWA domain-containing protein [Mastigocoleus testarum]KST63169.1 VWA containing CoxE family protein [Mastigocoleus testarum BC008]KST63186.1 VWA containing CoxE family protein [Mastigocoleus testarum BC008]
MKVQIVQRRQVIYWRLITTMFGLNEQGANFDLMSSEIVDELSLPQLILDPNISIENLLQRYPELEADFKQRITLQEIMGELSEESQNLGNQNLKNKDPEKKHLEKQEQETDTLRRGLVFSKILLNTFGPNTQTNTVTAQQYSQWLKDVGYLERSLGCSLRGQAAKISYGQKNQNEPGKLGNTQNSFTTSDFNATEEQLRATVKTLEGELIQRMALREVLQDDHLASQINPSMALVEQLLRDKANLSGNSLKNAKRLIRQYIDELAEVLRLQVTQTAIGKVDRSVPPKRVFRNLNLKRTIWKNLTNWSPQEGRLYVDRLYYQNTAKKKIPTRMIVVVDQSGSMVDAMVQCTILASIFAGLPNVDVHLIAFDTQVLDLTPWVRDPFEVLLRTQLGGGTHIYSALQEAAQKILAPQNTALVLISDFYEGGSDQVLFDYIKSLQESGVHFIPVGAVTTSGYFSVNQWFRNKLKELGTPILTGSPKKLIQELKKVIVS